MIAMVMIMMSENRQKLNCIAERIEDNQHKHEWSNNAAMMKLQRQHNTTQTHNPIQHTQC